MNLCAVLLGILSEAFVEERRSTNVAEWHWHRWVDDRWGKNRDEITPVSHVLCTCSLLQWSLALRKYSFRPSVPLFYSKWFWNCCAASFAVSDNGMIIEYAVECDVWQSVGERWEWWVITITVVAVEELNETGVEVGWMMHSGLLAILCLVLGLSCNKNIWVN